MILYAYFWQPIMANFFAAIVSYIKFALYKNGLRMKNVYLTTFSKYLSIVSTRLCINSSMLSSFYLPPLDWTNITYHIFIVVYPDDEIKGGISTIEYFVLPVFQKWALRILISYHLLPNLLCARGTYGLVHPRAWPFLRLKNYYSIWRCASAPAC